MSMPQVSVILPVYNREACVERAVRSVLAQTYRSFELIVVDDGSTDGTRRILDRFGPAIRVLEQAHSGAYAARNHGARQARADLLAFIDSDDAWLPALLEREVPLMQRPEVGLVFGDAVHVASPEPAGVRSGPTCFQVSRPRRGRVAAQFAWANFVPTCTALVRRRCFDEVGGFSDASEISSDYLMWFRVALHHELDYVGDVVAEYTVHPAGISYELGRAVEARLRLFSREMEGTKDPAIRTVLQRLLFNLSMSLALAALRGRARSVSHPLRLALRTALAMARSSAALWTAAFAMNQLRIRTQRLFS
jgi:glycosyltransferase involved in cell wall biosynthesis